MRANIFIKDASDQRGYAPRHELVMQSSEVKSHTTAGSTKGAGEGQPIGRCCVMLVIPFGRPAVTVLVLGSACRKPLVSWPVALM